MPFSLRGLSPIFWATNLLVWVSAVIVMGIISYWFSQEDQPDWLVYMLTISVLTVAFFLGVFIIGTYLPFLILFNLIFSYLWLAAVVFAAFMFTESGSDQALTVEAFSFIAFFALFFNVLYSVHLNSNVGEHGHRPMMSRPRV